MLEVLKMKQGFHCLEGKSTKKVSKKVVPPVSELNCPDKLLSDQGRGSIVSPK